MKTYLLIDTSNCFMRARHVGMAKDSWTQIGLALHITLNSIKNLWLRFNPDHVVFCAEGRSWRKTANSDYKQNRDVAKAALSTTEKEQLAEFFEMMNDFYQFIDTSTNATYLRDEMCEADDLIAGWIQNHPDDQHIIISADSDFHQLLTLNVRQYDPMKNFLYTVNGVFNDNGEIATDKKGNEVPNIDPEYTLFMKCIRGDVGDNVFSAYPGVREKGTKTKVGILEAYNDRNKKGYDWNTFMNSRWMHHDGTERIVKDEYKKNQMLIDLTMQPDYIKDRIKALIENVATTNKSVPMVGIHFLKFAQKYELMTIQQYPDQFVKFMMAKYN